MYRTGDVVTLNTDKSEGAGEASLYINSGITGMIVNNGRACREGDYSYVVDFGPEGQWNCVHSELDSLTDPYGEDNSGWDSSNEVELQQDITEEQAQLSIPPAPPISFESDMSNQGVNLKKNTKSVSFEDDLARIAAEAESNGG